MRIRTLCILGALAAMAGRAEAQAGLLSGLGGAVDFGEACLAPNDDGSSAEIDITPWFPSGLQFFDRTHRSVFVNTNGNISFSDSLSTFTPNAFPVANRPMIAPYWADVDIRDPDNCSSVSGSDPCRNPSENGVWWFGEPGRFVVTWHQVGYFLCSVDLRMNFQLIITQADNGCGGLGDFDVEFRYNRCEWETGDASGGTGGFGGTEAQAGFDAGNSRDFVEIPGSREPGIAESLCTGSNVGETGVWRFQIRRGTVTCPDAGEACETGELGACAEGRTACVGSGTECRSITPSTDEVCDNLDNDCDGNVDEGGDLCGGLEICDLGNCLDVCFEFGCPPGQTCTDEGRCIDDGCEDVECGLGERCSAGECVGACDDIVCPTGQTCIGGRCSDLCESIVCDEACQLCENGECIPACQFAACGPGFTCLADGRCFEDSCIGVTCADNEVCEGGTCRDRCDGAVCPAGEMCTDGDCVPMMTMPPPMPDAGVEDGGNLIGGGDAGPSDAGADGGDETAAEPPPRVARGDSGCSASGSSAPVSVVLGLLGLVATRRRR